MPIDLAADSGYALRLLVAAILGALVGLEREIHDHPAGMRTHLLVSLGSGGFTVLSIAAFPAPGADPARIRRSSPDLGLRRRATRRRGPGLCPLVTVP